MYCSINTRDACALYSFKHLWNASGGSELQACVAMLLALKYCNASRWLHVYFRDAAVQEQEYFFIICYVLHGTSGLTRSLSMSGASRIYTWRDSGVITFALFFLCRLPNQLPWFMFMALTPQSPIFFSCYFLQGNNLWSTTFFLRLHWDYWWI